ncbi:MAG: hypothetical protein JWQ38_1467 [Flavipsychrobacter sp.]|nr:hypothetical protein [Flavipsychrobacter sp.]
MSHKDEHIVCPNCGFQTSENYCARCGQETHLHDESFFGLIMHFIGHYFHYDSKFWKTMAALFASPGKLTKAYWNKQRMRYIPPVSLYIFISVVFFLVYTSLPSRLKKLSTYRQQNTDSVLAVAESEAPPAGRHIIRSMREKLDKVDSVDKNDSMLTVEQREAEMVQKHMQAHGKEIKEQALHMLPKVFFFLIPLMGLVLLLLFMKRKDLNYVSHVIFALHYHTLWFSIMLLEQLYRFQKGHSIVLASALIIAAVYFVISLKKTYSIGWLRSVWYSVVVGMAYSLFLLLAAVGIVAMIAIPYMNAVKDAVH